MSFTRFLHTSSLQLRFFDIRRNRVTEINVGRVMDVFLISSFRGNDATISVINLDKIVIFSWKNRIKSSVPSSVRLPLHAGDKCDESEKRSVGLCAAV